MIDQDKDRAAFEASYKSKHSMATTIRLASGRYYSTLVESAWQGWQASAERSAKRIAELKEEEGRLKARLIDKGLTPADKAQNFANNLSRSAARLDWLELHAKLDWTMLYDGIRITFDAPKGIENLSSISSAIDEAMKGGA